MLYILAYMVLGLPMKLLYPTKVLHKERLPKSKRVIVTSNHYRNMDCILYDFKFTRKFRFMAKKELFKNKLFGSVLKGLGAFPVDRDNFSPSVYKKTISLLKDNKTVFIFPEGTRNKKGTEEMLDVKSGIIAFASRGEAEIVPMLIYRKSRIFRKNYIIVGETFKIEGENPKRLTKDEVAQNLQRYEETMKNLRQELEEYVENKKNKNKKLEKKSLKQIEDVKEKMQK